MDNETELSRNRDTGLRILLVEDSTDTAALTEKWLRMEGHQVELARDGVSALAKAQEEPPDVVLVDIGLPGMNGYEVTERLKEQHTEKRPLVVAISGFQPEAVEKRSAETGIDLYCVKPIDPQELLKLLRRFQQIIDLGPGP
jgi:two-component system CheB/CheR fusion protein